jgi:hypothetical protein
MSMRDAYLTIDEVAAELRRSRPVVFQRIRRHNLTTYRLPPDRHTFVRRVDLDVLKQPVPLGRPVAIVKKRGGNRRWKAEPQLPAGS